MNTSLPFPAGRLLVLCSLSVLPFSGISQSFYWNDAFQNGCVSDCDASTYSGPNGAWTVTNTGVNDVDYNPWYVSGAECGNAPAVCGSVCGATDPSLHVGINASVVGDNGAIYLAGGLGIWFVETNLRAETPTIDCSGHDTITLCFNYIENGQGTTDDATLWYYNGTTWSLLDNLAKTTLCMSGQGSWTAFSILLPTDADNNPNVKIGFNWTNNDDNVGTDPSFAVDDIELSTLPSVASVTGSASVCINDVNVPYTIDSNPGTTYAWTLSGGGTITFGQGTDSITIDWGSTPGSYTVAVDEINCSGTVTHTSLLVIVGSCTGPPVANFTVSDTLICETTCISFTDASTGTPNSWAWSFPGATPDTSNDQNPTSICYDTAGVYSVTLSATNGSGTHDTTFLAFIDVDTPATVSANLDDIICGGIPYTLSGSMGGSASSVTWTTSGDGTFNDSSLLGAVYTPGSGDIGTVVTLTITTDDPAGPCGAASHLIGLDVNPLTTASAGPDTTICNTATYTITGSSIGGNAASQVWTTSGTGAFNNSSLLSPIYTPSSADTVAGCVTLTITTDDPVGPCLSTTDDMNLCFMSCVLPIPNFSASDTLICETTCINFMDSTLNSPTAWAWSFPGGTPDTSNIQDPIGICYNTPGTYAVTLSATNGNGTADTTFTTLISVDSLATVSAGVNDSICDSSSDTLSGSIGGGASSSTWTTSGDGTFSDSSLLNAVYTPGSADIGAGTVTLYLTTDDPAGPCVAVVDSIILTISASPVLDSIVAVDASACGTADGTANLFVTGGAAPILYSINGGTSYVGGSSFSSLAVGSYSGIVIDDNGCISNSVGFTISAPGSPAPPIGSPDDTLCDGDIISDLTATGSNIEWFSDSLLSNLLGTGSPFPISPTVGVTVYYVTQTVSGCQSAADTVIITINTTPGPPTTGIDPGYCVGESVADITASGTNITWYSDAALTTMIGSGSPFAITPGLGTTVYYATDSINGCTGPADSVVITINAIPATPVAGTDATYCSGASIADLTSTGTNPLWYADAALTSSIGSGSTLIITPPIGTTTYYVIDSVAGCFGAADSVFIIVDSTPGAPTTGIDTGYCVGESVADITASGTNITWYSDAALTTMIGSGSPFAITPGLGTTVYYATDSINGCTGPADSVVITVNAIPATPVAGTDATYCSGATIADLTSTGTNPLWYSDAALTSPIGSGSTLTITPPIGTTTYYVIDSVAGCVGAADSVVIAVNVSPGAPIAGSDSTYCFGDTIADLIATGTGLEWFSDAGLTASLGTGSTLSISPGVGTTTYQVTATDFGCQSTASQVTITVDPCIVQNDTAVFVPNIFKPSSGNPDNEKLYVFGSLIESYTLMIFERWGPKVYETSDATQTSLNDGITCCKYGEGWDGNYQSSDKKLNTAVFDYVLIGTYSTGETFTRKGSITLLK